MSKLFFILMLSCNFIWLYSFDRDLVDQETSISIPEKYQNLALQKCTLSHLEKKFAKQFPGIIETYQHANGVVIFRQVTGATRKLHNSRTCLISSGFKLSQATPVRYNDGIVWQTYTAENSKGILIVRSVILSPSNGKTWSTVEEWFWDAFFSNSDQIYLAITEISDLK